jgi:DNA topoisomerase-3
MSNKVIIAEKPSVAKNIAEALNIKQRKDGYFEGNNYIITWAFGHLLQLYDAKDYDSSMSVWKIEKFPFIPERFKYKVKTDPKNRDKKDSGAYKQINTIKELINRQDVDGVISACDYDREGQIIGDIILGYLRIKKPVYRLLLNEWTAAVVIEGLKKIKVNTEMKPLQDAGISRQWADWTIGINLTSVATLKYQRGKGKSLNIGRVLLPTLKIIYDRDKEIEDFVSKDYYRLIATFKTEDNKLYDGVYTLKNEDKFDNKEKLELELSKLKDIKGIITNKEIERKKEYAPYLFNLSNLQGYITSKYKGWTSDKVLKVAQSLYEKKYITYPRTSSIVLEESLVDRVQKVLNELKKGLSYEDEIKFNASKRIFDNSKVESHSAIIPTYLLPKNLSSDEGIVYTAIKNRLLMQFMPVAEYEETKITTKIQQNIIEGVFISKGKVQIAEGWKKVEKIESKDTILPLVTINQIVDVVDSKVTSHNTKPPKHHTEKTLLRVMETCGKKYDEEDSNEMMDAILSGFSIGTPATRAETIKKLKAVGYIYAKDKALLCSELGKKLVETFPISELFDLEYTGRLEKTLSDIEKGKLQKSDFLNLIFQFTQKSIDIIKNDKDIILNYVTSVNADNEKNTKNKAAAKNNIKNNTAKNNSAISDNDKININNNINEITKDSQKNTIETLGKCPLCGNDIIEGKKGFGCSNWKNGCKFVIWKEDNYLKSMGKKITKTMVKKLLRDGKVDIKGLKSKNGNTFDATLKYVKSLENNYFSWEMGFEKGGTK